MHRANGRSSVVEYSDLRAARVERRVANTFGFDAANAGAVQKDGAARCETHK
jgi:hypothetical protein